MDALVKESDRGPKFLISYSESASIGPITGRVFLVLSPTNDPEVRFQSTGVDGAPIFGVGVEQLLPGQEVIVDCTTLGYPLRSSGEIPPGDYFVQAYAKVYLEYPRADGHTLWALDQWDGHDFALSPGVLYSDAQHVHFDPSVNQSIHLVMSESVPAPTPPVDTEWVEHVKIESRLLSEFWGRPIFLGADVVLPRDYSSDEQRFYPIIYEPRNHYRRDCPFGFAEVDVAETDDERHERESLGFETGYEFFQSWKGDDFPRLIAVTLINPTPFYDFSSAMNSVNNGPYQNAIMTELIPYIENHYRVIRQPHARVLVGKSSGGRDALGLQIHNPEFFGGVWVFHPWAFNYRNYFSFNIYENKNAFEVAWQECPGLRVRKNWAPVERIFVQSTDGRPAYTVRDWVLYEAVVGGQSGVGAEVTGSDDALNSPIGDDGYPKQLYDKLTGKIDREVAEHWRSHDLAHFLEANWSRIGRHLEGKLHFSVGDRDEWFRNFGVRDLETILEKTTDPYYSGSFVYSPTKGHRWQQTTNAELVKVVAEFIAEQAPR